jgi:hypothetical protein
MKPGDKDKKGSVLRLEGSYASIWTRKDGVWIVRTQTGDHFKLTAIDALGVYNSLNGTNYPSIPKLPIPEMGEPLVVPSSSKPGVTYEVSQDSTGALWCTCPGFGYRRHCSHVEAVTELLIEGKPKDKDLTEDL